MNSENKKVLLNIIGAVESGGQIYGKRNYGSYAGKYQNSKKELTCTLGWAQLYGYEAMELVRRIYAKSPQTFIAADNANIKAMLERDWVDIGWNPTTAQRQSLINIITTPVGKEIQDELAMERIEKYIKRAEEFGVIDVGAQMMWAEIQHLGGLSAVKRIFDKIAKPYSADKVYQTLLLDQQDRTSNNQVGDKIYQSRHEKCMQFIKQYMIEEKKGGAMNVNKVIEIEKSWIGYIEKASNARLEEKTANKGTGNYQRFSRIVDRAGLMGCQGQAWCGSFQFACEIEAYGLDQALKNWGMTHKSYVGYNCFSTFNSFAQRGKTSKSPKVGALVVFTFSHIGRVIKVDEAARRFWTIEGNTSPNTYDRNGGMVAMKSYSFNDSKIKGFCIIDYDEVAPHQESQAGNPIIETGQRLANSFTWSREEADGIRGAMTRKLAAKVLQVAMNADYGARLVIDGIFGEKSKAALKGHYVKEGESQWMVSAAEILMMLDGYDPKGFECPGYFGKGLGDTAERYQKEHGLEVDRVIGYKTFLSLLE